MSSPSSLAVAEGVRALLGVMSLMRSDRGARGRAREERPFPAALLRVLGLRQVAQAVLTAGFGAAARPISGAVDTLHAVSMVAVAVVSPRYRRAATTQAVIAACLALLELRGVPDDSAVR